MAEDNSQPQIMVIKLRRNDTSQPWGFRMRGGAQQGMPLFVEHVAPNSRAARGGLSAGDGILMICKTNVTKASHDQGKGEVLRAGNELDFTVQKGACVGLVPIPTSPNAHAPNRGGAMIKTATAMRSMERKVSDSMSPCRSPEQRVRLSQPYKEEPRAEVIEEPSTRFGGPVYKNIVPKSYQMLESQLSTPNDPPESPSEVSRPASIFDRNRQDRSAYLNANGPTIQKAYGQNQ